MKVLIVDDDPVDREDVQRALCRQADCEVVCASRASEALKVLAECTFDVILLDYRMPGRDGIELLLTLRSEKDAATPVVMMSTVETDELALQCLRAGAQDFIVKSEISTAKLHRAILQAQARFQLERRLRSSDYSRKALSERDSLTGIANRATFDQCLRVAVERAERSGDNFATLLLDLDRFKEVNDGHGHEIGDQLLRALAARLDRNLGDRATFARLWGDEFAILVPKSDGEDLQTFSQELLKTVALPLHVAGLAFSMSGSIGIARFPEDADNAHQLLRFADIAMYRAKRHGGNRASFYEPTMEEQLQQTVQMEKRLRAALANEEFAVYYQPQYVVSQRSLTETRRKLVGFEALVRWHDNGRLVLPGEFMPVAESSKLVVELGRWVIDKSLEQLAVWNTFRSQPLSMSINLSVEQLNDLGLAEFVHERLSSLGVAPGLVEFELTETALLDREHHEVESLNQLKSVGCRLALDDFGTGFSSISHLQEFPLDTVKIDRSLMPSADNSERTIPLVRGLAAMVHSLGLETVAEGIEHKAQLDFCQELGVHRLQGFLLGKPKLGLDLTSQVRSAA